MAESKEKSKVMVVKRAEGRLKGIYEPIQDGEVETAPIIAVPGGVKELKAQEEGCQVCDANGEKTGKSIGLVRTKRRGDVLAIVCRPTSTKRNCL